MTHHFEIIHHQTNDPQTGFTLHDTAELVGGIQMTTTTFIHCRECGHTWTDLTKREIPTTTPNAYEIKQVSLDRCTQHTPKP